MKFVAALLCTAVAAFAISLYLPWWSIAIAAFLVAVLIRQKPGLAYLAAFGALFILWSALSYYISIENENLFAEKASVLIIKNTNPMMLIMTTALSGAITAGFAALSGSLLSRVFIKKNKV